MKVFSVSLFTVLAILAASNVSAASDTNALCQEILGELAQGDAMTACICNLGTPEETNSAQCNGVPRIPSRGSGSCQITVVGRVCTNAAPAESPAAGVALFGPNLSRNRTEKTPSRAVTRRR